MISKILFWLNTDRVGPDIPLTHFLLHFNRCQKYLCSRKFYKFGVGAEFRAGAYAVCTKSISIGERVVIRPGSMLFASDAGEILVVIPARGGSKRLPRKNVLPLAGKPLICWTIEAAVDAKLNARIVVTSDDDEILTIARQYESQGVLAHKRPDDLATDTASTAAVLIDAVRAEHSVGRDPKTIILLQPTSPLRSAEDIILALGVFCDAGCDDSVLTVCEVDHPSAWIGYIGDDSKLEGVEILGKRTQDYKTEHRLNGAVYVVNVERLLGSGVIFTGNLYVSVMPKERSLDIDDEFDFKRCEFFIGHSL